MLGLLINVTYIRLEAAKMDGPRRKLFRLSSSPNSTPGAMIALPFSVS